MSTKPTPEQVAAEIEQLKALLPRVRPTSMFGDDNSAAIRAQIDVLAAAMSLHGVTSRFGGDDDDQYQLCSALSAHDWLHGILAADELSPAKSWEGLVQ